METRFLARSAQRLKLSSSCLRHHRLQHTSSHSKPSTHQANPLGEYYTSLLETPTPRIKSKPPTTAALRTQAPSTAPDSSTEETADPSGPAILFSSRLSSPLERRSEIQRKSTLEAGVWVPPRPDEPDNCCMSGCVNCVWDLFRDEMEHWVVKRKEADYALRKERSLEGARKKRRREDGGMGGSTGSGLMRGEGEKGAAHTMISMDDDGGGSEALWGKGLDSEPMAEDVFKNIPVGIREFMKQEKRLKEKHAREGTSA